MNRISVKKQSLNPAGLKSKKGFLYTLRRNIPFLVLMLPGIVVLIVNSYLPLFGVTIAFKSIDYNLGIFSSPWVGLKNFEFLFATSDIWIAIKNTLLYNTVFIVAGTIMSLFIAIALNELRGKLASKIYQTILIMPSFLSIIVIASIVNALLAEKTGFINSNILNKLGMDGVKWFSQPFYWYFILPIVNVWKSAGMGSILYLATIRGFDPALYEAASVDGATKLRQIKVLTLPMLKPVIAIQTILAVGNMFRADIGMFQQVTGNSPLLLPSVDVIDTFVYRSLIQLQDVGMSSAASFMQSAVGCVLLIITNTVVKRLDPDSSLF